MGGYGSGRPWSGRANLDGLIRIDINMFVRKRLLHVGCCFSFSWRDRHGPFWLSVSVQADYLILQFSREGAETIREIVHLTWQSCHYGGQRAWFNCPFCGRKSAKLFYWGEFVCRRCTGLKYQSQRVDLATRQLYQAHKIREKLGGAGDSTAPYPWKPKGMHYVTYWRMSKKAIDNEMFFIKATLPYLRCRSK